MDTTVAPLASIGVDIGKEVFHLVGFGADGKIAFRRKIRRPTLIEYQQLPLSTHELTRDQQPVYTLGPNPIPRVFYFGLAALEETHT